MRDKKYEMTVRLSRNGVIELGYWIEEAMRLNPLDDVEEELRAFVNSIDEQLENAERLED